MVESSRGYREGWLPLIAGLYWLWSAPAHGLPGFLVSVLPGTLLLGSGLAMLGMPGELRIGQFAALGGALGVLAALPALPLVGAGHGLLLLAASALGFVAAGAYTLRVETRVEEVPASAKGLRLAAEVALDELVLSSNTLAAMLRSGGDLARIRREVARARELFDAAGWLEKPESYHRGPPGLESPELSPAATGGIAYEHLRFESGYEPHDEEPGASRWLGYAENRVAHAWVLRHRGAPRPWLICIHGYRMGRPIVDLHAFRPDWLHRQLGLNLLLPVLPLHGPRAPGWSSGDGYLGADVIDTLHAEAQAVWDVRRMLAWLEGQGAMKIGVYGISLGGYNAALLASLCEGLSCAIVGVPAVDLAHLLFRHSPAMQVREAQLHDIKERDVSDVLRVVSPLALTPRVSRERRFLFAGTADRIVPPEQARDLWRHWERPRMAWYPGAHLTFAAHPEPRALVEEGLRAGGLTR
ncbi:MAG: hypothetical protein OEM49_03600 [Myxococcales bacterium]|nr:hypothetical protein [Myxococcales bacterium]MDH5565118.1 hypothetical protein [Myxococcales bacterium]